MEDSQSESNIFSVRIVSIDYYMAPPVSGIDICYSTFQGGKVNEVPVIRIYGSTPAGQKTCLHVHRALPYLYVPCSDLLLQPDQEGDACANVLSHAIEKALKLKGNTGSKRQHVHDCSLVRAKKFYGYHSSEELFAKIYLYYPQDVSRAANLLLGGAVLDKIIQPHESHIPFLLQFLVDYNLYGMGHLHVSKMKFRHPIPDVFSRRKANDDNRQHSATDFQADSSGDARSGSPIWLSSTIPDGWIWQSSSQFDSSPDNNVHFVKRQSTCELEGDAAVEEILNQQSMLFSSLSQTHSDVKMVQSLIPIWEEEFQRTGIHGPAMVSESGKPLPQDVLRTLTNGFEFEVKLMELCVIDAENSSPCTRFENQTPFSQSMRSLTDLGNVVGFGHTNLKTNTTETPELSKASDGIGVLPSQESPCEQDELQISDVAGPSQLKAADEEALSLLKWLASSQAAEDINSDDELARETILSPLLPTTTIDKVLEKANIDFESESQKECQDILDCVEDSPNLESLKGSSEKMFPMVDGSSNDQSLMPLAAKSSENKMNSEYEKSLHDFVNRDIGSSSNSKHKRKRPLWGSLPFSLTQKVNDDLQPSSSNLTGRYDNDTKDGKINCFSSEASTVVGCSVRDLMRRKRSLRVEALEGEIPRITKVSSQGESQKDAFVCTKQRADGQGVRALSSSHSTPSSADELTEFHEKNVCAETSALEDCREGQPNGPLMHGKLSLSSGSNDGNFCSSEGLGFVLTGATREENFEGLVVTTSTNLVRPDKLGSEHHGREIDVSQPGGSVSMALKMEANPVELSGTSLCNKPSMIECTKGISGNAYLSSDSPNCPCPADEKYEQNYEQTPVQDGVVDKCLDRREVQHVNHRTSDLNFEEGVMGVSTHYQNNSSDLFMLAPVVSPPLTDSVHKWLLNDGTVQDGVVDECFPFFEGDYQEGKEVESLRCGSVDLNYRRQVIMGVPTHYQNDGSYLYMLTPAFSPPLTDTVHKWLLNDGSGPSGNPVDLDGSLDDDCDEPLPESGSISNAKPTLEQVKQQIPGSNDAQMQPLHNEVITTVLKREGNVSKVKQGSGCSQDISQISGPDGKSKLTPLSQIGFRDPASVGGGQQLTLLSIEVQAESRGDLRSDPRFDAINLIVLVVQEDEDHIRDAYVLVRHDTEDVQRNIDGTTGCKVLVSSEEKHLFNHFIKIISSFDPDILIGWDIQGGSLGFLAERAAYLGIGLLNKISRTPSQSIATAIDSDIQDKGIVKNDLPETLMADTVLIEDAIIEDEWGRTHASGVHVGGRVVLNVWRLMRGEVKLNMYTAAAVAEAVLRRKIPFIHCKVLTNWFSSGPGRARHRCIEYILERAKLNLQLMNQLDLINRTSELARVFGIDFFSVLSRGSQYRVESMLLRLAHTQNYLAISPGPQQVASQPAMECLPLVMEPESGFYADPVVVLDFQSLYPSMIIAYNLCFSTCLGKITPSNSNILGVSSYSPDPNVLRNLKREVLLTPNGVMYMPSKVRKGVLPRLLDEILSTRIMVKQAMKKLAPSQQVLNRIFNARQLALKLIANVTYGYTAAGFSGRMPCAELADSIVQCGRRTLETAISLVNMHDKWKAKVIYGDTDSMFVLLRGRSVKEAFKIGYEIASAVSAMNPSPVTLKMEKVYHPCFLLTKKRYVGYSYESPDQLKPVFDAKGIETIRRDTCAAVSKTMEQSLRLFFEHQDISKVKSYLLRQWTRILSGRVSLQDFIFAKEVRLGTYSTRTSSLPPAAIVATKAMRSDPRAEPRYGDRIPYVVVHGEPGARLVDMVVDPLDLMAIDSPFRLNDLYYINKQIIPALQRVFGLLGADLNQWFLDMPRPARESVGKRNFFAQNHHHPHRTRIDYYYLSQHCVVCGELVQASAHLCDKCSKNNAGAATAVIGRTSKLEREIQHLVAICRHCGGGDWLTESGVKCTSLACSVFYERRKLQKELQSISAVATELGLYPRCMVEWF